MKKIVFGFSLTLIIFGGSLFYQTYDVSGNFVGTRRFGWPLQFGISKVTGDSIEADRVRYDNIENLLTDGWKINLNELATKGLLDFVMYLILSFVLAFGPGKIIAVYKKSKNSN